MMIMEVKKRDTIFSSIILTVVIIVVLYVGWKISWGMYEKFNKICQDTNDTVEIEEGIIDCYQWNIGNYTSIATNGRTSTIV